MIVLATVAALYLGLVPFSITHLDLARDLALGLDIAQGRDFPVDGPILANTVHFGPIWYYLLAIPLLVFPSWLAAAAVIGALAALKFPLAYAIGTQLADRRTGLVWALLLLLPGWTTYEVIAQFHPSLVATCVLAGLWYLIKFSRSGSIAHLFAVGLLFGLALHAHPSAVGFLALVPPAIIHRYRLGRAPPLKSYFMLTAGILMPFTPYVLSQAVSGFPEFYRAVEYLTDERSVGDVRNLARVLVGTFIAGPQAVGDGFWTWVPSGGRIAAIGCATVYAAGALGILAAFVRRERAGVALAAIASMLAVALAVASIRAVTPFYMTYVVWVFASGLLALGLAECTKMRPLAWAGRAGVSLAAILIVITQASAAVALARGAYVFGYVPLFDVKRPSQGGQPMPFVPAHATGLIGRILCSEPAVAAHGILAVHLLHDYAVESRFECGTASHITIGGLVAGSGSARTGISRSAAMNLGVIPDVWAGPVGLMPVVRVLNPSVGAPVPLAPKYPPVEGRFLNPSSYTFEFEAEADEAVVVTNAYFTFSPMPTVAATANGRDLPPGATDHVSAGYLCRDCQPRAGVKWRLIVTTPAIERVDIVTVRAAARP